MVLFGGIEGVLGVLELYLLFNLVGYVLVEMLLDCLVVYNLLVYVDGVWILLCILVFVQLLQVIVIVVDLYLKVWISGMDIDWIVEFIEVDVLVSELLEVLVVKVSCGLVFQFELRCLLLLIVK